VASYLASRVAADSSLAVIAYDGSPGVEHALHAAAGVLAPTRAVVVVVWKQGIGVETVVVPEFTGDLPPAQLDVRTGAEVDQAMQERARQLAERGAALAREAGFDARGLAVADVVDVTVAETLLDVARSQDAAAIVLGSHGHGPVLGATTRDVIRRAGCPVVVLRAAADGQPA
jgi:nucleotide-binding universal stress UspA family protein